MRADKPSTQPRDGGMGELNNSEAIVSHTHGKHEKIDQSQVKSKWL